MEAADTVPPVAEEDLVAGLGLAAAAERAVGVGLRVGRACGHVDRAMHLQQRLEARTFITALARVAARLQQDGAKGALGR